MTPTDEWETACAELVAALEEATRRDCGVSADTGRLLDVVLRDEDCGAASLRHAARAVRRELPVMARQARRVEAARVEFWASRGEPEQASATPWGG